MVAVLLPAPRPAERTVAAAARVPAPVLRRRRAAALALLAGVAFALAVLLPAALGVLAPDTDGAVQAGAPSPVGPAAGTAYVVEPGDTVWTIARTLQPEGDVRALVDDIVEANGGASLVAGQRLLLG